MCRCTYIWHTNYFVVETFLAPSISDKQYSLYIIDWQVTILLKKKTFNKYQWFSGFFSDFITFTNATVILIFYFKSCDSY